MLINLRLSESKGKMYFYYAEREQIHASKSVNLFQEQTNRRQHELEDAQMRAKGLELMIDMAEKEYGVKIKKNSGARR